MTDLPPQLSALLEEQGVDASRSHRVLAALADGGWWSARDLVRSTAVAHRLVERILDALGPDLEHDGQRVRLRDAAGYTVFDRPLPADPVAHLAGRHPRAAAELRRLVAQAPESRIDLDHVAATADTALRRGLFLATRFHLPGARLLCVGDHDLTSLAATLVEPRLEAVVVDVDERMLDYIDSAAARLDLRVRCYFADLRLGLPAAVRGRADLVFTDPPYTPEGVELFLRRGLEGLASPGDGRTLLAYGASETTPALVARTQARLTRLNLATEAIWPDFNRYLGAEGIGAASDLYVLRATSRTPVGTDEREAARIYSQGSNAKEARGGLAPDAAGDLLERVDADLVVGAWPSADRDLPRARLSTWFASPVSAHRALVDLTGGWEHLAGRAILAGRAPELHVVVPSASADVRDQAGQEALRRLVAPLYDLRFLRGVPDPRHTVILARRRSDRPDDTPGQRLLRHCQERAHGSVASALREGLIRVAADLGRSINKKTARTSVAAAAPWLSGHTLLDLPLHRLERLGEVTDLLTADLCTPG
ncbi:bis-aminopropyl spermidine synthase family protein [Marinactinospora endophytica]